MQGTITESVRKQYEAYSYPPPIEDGAAFAPSASGCGDRRIFCSVAVYGNPPDQP